MNLDWPAARELLEQVYEQYLERGAPAMGVDTLPLTSDESIGRQATAIIQELVRSGWLEVPYESANGPRSVRPSPAALQLRAGWPTDGAQEVLGGLVEALNAEIDRTPESTRRSVLVQVRDGLIGAARDVAIAYVEKKTGIS